MPRETYVLRKGKLVPKSRAAPLPAAGPYVISDYLPDLIHPITGKRMSSKAAFRATTKAYGCTEVGTEKLVNRPRFEMPDPGPDIVRAIQRGMSDEP